MSDPVTITLHPDTAKAIQSLWDQFRTQQRTGIPVDVLAVLGLLDTLINDYREAS